MSPSVGCDGFASVYARRILEREGACVRVATDGAQAVALLREGRDDFDAVLMDVQMPVLDGLAATQRIRGELGLTSLPVIALTAGALLSERQRALEAGMDGFVSKPFDPQALVSLLHQRVERARGKRLPLAQRTAQREQNPGAWPQIDGIDEADVRRRLEDDLPLFARLLGQLVVEFGDLAGPANDEAMASGGEPLAARLHKLAGSAGLLGAVDVRSAAALGESMIRGGKDASQMTPVLLQLAGALHRLLQSSQPWRTRFQAGRELQTHDTAADAHAPPSADEMLAWELELGRQDMAALSRFQAMTPSLRRTWSGERFESIDAAMHRLDFSLVLNLLRSPP